jgi:hypothetical protein
MVPATGLAPGVPTPSLPDPFGLIVKSIFVLDPVGLMLGEVFAAAFVTVNPLTAEPAGDNVK